MVKQTSYLPEGSSSLLDHESEARVRGFSQQIDAHAIHLVLMKDVPEVGGAKDAKVNLRESRSTCVREGRRQEGRRE